MHFLIADACVVNVQNIIVLPFFLRFLSWGDPKVHFCFQGIKYVTFLLMLSGHQRCIFVQFYVFMGLEQYAIGVVQFRI